jgi:hypothetical protein
MRTLFILVQWGMKCPSFMSKKLYWDKWSTTKISTSTVTYQKVDQYMTLSKIQPEHKMTKSYRLTFW